MAAYDDRPDKKTGNPGDDYRRLLLASKKHRIRVQTIPGVRGMLVLKDEADAYLAQCKKVAAERPISVAKPLVPLLAKIAELLEKVANTLESMA